MSGKKMGRKGKYHKWIEKEGLTLIEGWARAGLSDEQIAHNIGIRRETLYDWINKYPNISHARKKGKEVADFEVENALYKSALGYEVEEVKTIFEDTDNGQRKRVEKTKKQMSPNVTAQIFWLKNRKSEDWRDRRDVDHSGEITQNLNNVKNLSEEELRKLAELSGDEDD